MACTPTIPTVDVANHKPVNVTDKYKELMQASIGTDSIYERAKATVFEFSKDLNMTEKERLGVVSDMVGKMTISLSGDAMKTALGWASYLNKSAYESALLEAQVKKALSEAAYEAAKLCLIEKEIEYKCAQTIATISGTIRENGKPVLGTDGCTVLGLEDEGLKYEQTLQVNASKYQILAESYRKSGVVETQVGIDGIMKGIVGNPDGHLYEQTRIASRQVDSFEDSKRNHAANAASQTIGQILSADEVPAKELMYHYKKALAYLNQDTVPSGVAGGAETLPAITIDASDARADKLDGNGNKTANALTGGSVNLVSVVVNIDTRMRVSDRIVVRFESGDTITRNLSAQEIQEGSVSLRTASITFDPTVGTAYGKSDYSMTAFITDPAGNVTNRLKLKFMVPFKK